MNLKPVIDILLEKFIDGKPFFDELDKTLRNPYFFLPLWRHVQSDHDSSISFHGLAVSGEFGERFADWAARSGVVGLPIYLYPGDLRHSPEKALTKRYNLKGKHIAFIDDSIYRGRTFTAVQEAAKRDGGFLCGPYVLYDGSTLPNVAHSFYRYFAHHPERVHTHGQNGPCDEQVV